MFDKFRKIFAVAAVMLCTCVAMPSTVYAIEPDSTPEPTLAPDATASAEASPDATGNPTPEAVIEATPEATASSKATTEATATAEISSVAVTAASGAATTEATVAATPTVTLPPLPPAYIKTSQLMTGKDFNIAVKKLAGTNATSAYTTDRSVKAFVITRSAPPDDATTVDLNVYSGSGSTPLLAWFDSSTGTVYCYDRATLFSLNSDCSNMFQGFKSLASIDLLTSVTRRLTNLTSGVTDMSYMFSDCDSLTSLDVSKWDVSSVTNMANMFYDCSGLTTVDVSNWNVSKVTSMENMFCGCTGLATLDASTWDTSSVTDMGGMFSYCTALTSVSVSAFNTSKVTSMAYMFDGCSSLASLDVSGFDTRSVTSMSHMLSEYFASSALREITLGSLFVIPSNAKGVFSTPTLTASGAKSSGTWGLGSETAETQYTSSELTALGQTAGALTGTWYAQSLPTATIHFNSDPDVLVSGTMADQTITGTQNLNANAFSAAGYRFYGWTTETNSWMSATHKGVFYADQASYNAANGDATLHAYLIPEDHDFTIRVLDTNNNPVSGVTVRYWQKFSGGYDSGDAVVKGEYTTGSDGTVSAGKYRAVLLSSEQTGTDTSGISSADASWNGVCPMPSGGMDYMITAAPDGYEYSTKTFSDAIYGYVNLSGSKNLNTPDDYTLTSTPTIAAQSDGSYLVTLYIAKPTTITFDANAADATGTMDAQTLTATGNLNTVQFKRAGYWFTGWNTKADGSGFPCEDGSEITPNGNDMTLYAQWKTGVELPESGYPGDPTSRIVAMGFALFGLILLLSARNEDK